MNPLWILKVLWNLLTGKKFLEFLTRNWKTIVISAAIIFTYFYISHLRSEISDRDSIISKYEADSIEQKKLILVLEEQARKDNRRILNQTKDIEREARDARPEDNAPFNPALSRSLERLWELDQSRRN